MPLQNTSSSPYGYPNMQKLVYPEETNSGMPPLITNKASNEYLKSLREPVYNVLQRPTGNITPPPLVDRISPPPVNRNVKPIGGKRRAKKSVKQRRIKGRQTYRKRR